MKREYGYVYNELLKLLSEFAKKRGINNSGNLSSIIEDSLNFVMLVVEIEEHFGIYIGEEFLDISNFSSIDEVCKLICEAEDEE